MKKYFLSALLGLAFSGQSLSAQETDTTAGYLLSLFIENGEKISKPGTAMLLLRNGKTTTLARLLQSRDYTEADHVLGDLDGDSKPELLVYQFTGGAHCCDEVTIYRKNGTRYQYAGHLYGGHTVINEDRSFTYSLHELFGYFFTCFACSLEDSTTAAPLDPSLLLVRYQKGRLSVVPGNDELKRYIIDNLSKLSEMEYPALGEERMDEGFRKAYALNLAVYYFSYGKNLAAVQQLFQRYYKFPDAKTVWASFRQYLTNADKQNSF